MDRIDLKRTFSKPPVLGTDRLILRQMRPDDAEDMFEYASRDDVTKYLTWKPHDSLRTTKSYLNLITAKYRRGEFYDWAVVLRDPDGGEGKMIGTCGFTSFDLNNSSAEAGYVINPAYRGRGYAPEALCRVERFAFCELGLHRLESRYIVGNDSSRRVMEKAGMKFEGIRRGGVRIDGSFYDVGVCAILAQEFPSNPYSS